MTLFLFINGLTLKLISLLILLLLEVLELGSNLSGSCYNTISDDVLSFLYYFGYSLPSDLVGELSPVTTVPARCIPESANEAGPVLNFSSNSGRFEVKYFAGLRPRLRL